MKIGDKLMNFRLPGTDGRTWSNFDFADRHALLLVITCNHCPYARAYWKRLIRLAHRYEEDNLGIAAICSNDAQQYPDDSFENMQKRNLAPPAPRKFSCSTAAANWFTAVPSMIRGTMKRL